MAGTLCLLIFLVLFIGFNLKSGVALRDHSFSDTDDRCPPSPHPLGMCKDRVAAYGYPCEEYHVTTEDGYILSLKRIPYGLKNADNSTENVRPPVLLFHGLMVDGFSWVLSTPKQSLGFILADGGFDVWIANNRGTNSSRGHTSLSTKDPAYWNWTWDQIAAHDLPAVLQFVYDNTGGQRVHYIGHSLGTLIILASFSEHKLLHLVRSAVLLCPIAYLNRMRSKLVRLAANIFLAETVHMLGYHEFSPIGAVAREILSQVCTDPEIDCYDLFGAVGGPDCCLNTSTTCTFLQHGPQSTSVKTLIHLSQMVRKQGIKKYDYGNAKENMKHYNQSRPPRYNLSDIPNDVPLFLTHGGVDYLGDLPDTRHLLRTLVRRHESDNIEVLYMPDFAHGDFVMAYNAPELIYKPMVEFFKRHVLFSRHASTREIPRSQVHAILSFSQPSIAGGTFIYDASAVGFHLDSATTTQAARPRKRNTRYYERNIASDQSIGLNSDGAAAQRGFGGAAAPGGAEARRACGARALRLAPRRRAAVVPVVPPVGVHGPLRPVRRRALVAPLPRARRARPRRRALPPRLPRHAPALLRSGPALPLRRVGGGLPLPLLLLPPRGAPPPAVPRQAPHQERPRPAQLHRTPRLLLPPPRLPRRAMLRRRGGVQGLVVRHIRRQRAFLRQRGAQRRRGVLPRDGVLDVPQRRLPPHLRAVQAHLPPPGAPARGLRRVAAVRGRGGEDRRRAGAQGAPRHTKAAQGHQPPVQEVHRRRAAHRHRQPVLRRAPHHATRLRRRPAQHRRARALLSGAHVRAHHNPEQCRQDHSPGAGPHRPHHQVARLLHHRAGQRRGGGHADVHQPQLHDRARPSQRQRLGVQRGDRGRRRGPSREHQVHAAASARPLVPEETGASDVPGEQQSRDHRVRVHAGPGVPAHHLHARVDALPLAARQDHRILVNVGRRCNVQVEVVCRSCSC